MLATAIGLHRQGCRNLHLRCRVYSLKLFVMFLLRGLDMTM